MVEFCRRFTVNSPAVLDANAQSTRLFAAPLR
jgi:hypothetical protein